jgi:hypothetical protein
MKKILTTLVALLLTASFSFAQQYRADVSKVRNAKERSMMKPDRISIQKASNSKATGDTISTFPWTEGFDNGTIPSSFTLIDNDNDGFNWSAAYLYNQGAGHNASAGFVSSASYDGNSQSPLYPDNWLILPSFTLPTNASDFSLSWYVKGQDPSYVDEVYSVYICTTGRTVANFTATTAVFKDTATADWIKRTVNLSSYAGQTIQIAFRHHDCTDMWYLNIDDIRVGGSAMPELSLNGPTSVRINSAATFTATSDVATISWNVDGNSYFPSTSNTLSYTFTTTGSHFVAASATNSVGTSHDTIFVNAFDCDEITSFPYILDGETESLLDCFSIIDGDGDGNNWMTMAGYGVNGSTALASFSYQSGVLYPDNWMIFPAMVIGSNTNLLLSWFEKAYSSSYANDYYSVYIGTSDDTAALAATTPVYSGTCSADWVKHSVNLASYTGQTIYIAFRHYNCSDEYAVLLDDIRIGGPEVPVIALEGPVQVRTNENVTFTATSDVNNFRWYVDNMMIPSENSETFVCSFATAGDHSVVAEAYNTVGSTFDTINLVAYACETLSIPFTADFSNGFTPCWDYEGWDTLNAGQFVYSMSAQSFFGMMMPLDQDNWLVTPSIEMPTTGSYQVEWNVAPYTADYPADHYTVYILSGNDTVELFSETLTANMATALQPRAVAIPNSISGDFKVAFRHYDCDGGYVILFNGIKVNALSAPSVILDGPAYVEVNQPATFTATSGTATSYAWTVDGTAQSANGNTLTYTFTTSGNHTVSVTASNNEGAGAPAQMTVNAYSCETINAPWIENFEGNTQCWNFVTNDNGSNGFSVIEPFTYQGEVYNYAHDGEHCLAGAYSDDFDVDQWAISPAITMPTNASNYELGYFVMMSEYQNIQTNYEVRVSNGGTAFADFNTVLFSESGNSNQSYAQRKIDMSQYAGQTIRIAFRNITPMGGDAMFIDDIEISDNIVGINTVSDIAVNVYPNPANNIINVEGEGIQNVQILDINGRTVMNANAGSIDISRLANGIYFVRAIATEGVSTVKIVKK